MPTRDTVVIGASAGGVEALRVLIAGLPADLPAAVLVCLHVPARGGSALAKILDRAGELPAANAVHGEPLEPGRIYVAPPDRHLLVADDHLLLSVGPRENGFRPAVDAMFRSAAVSRGPRVIGIVLSGALDDGTAGLGAVRDRGGSTLVQDPQDALHPSMPRSAIAHVGPDHVMSAEKIPDLVSRLCREEVDPASAPAPTATVETEDAMARLDSQGFHDPERPGHPAGLSCADCNGALWQIEDGGMLRFRCRVGHAWSPDSLLSAQSEGVEDALWMALRALEDKAALCHNLSTQARERERPLSAEHFDASAGEATRGAQAIRRLLEQLAEHSAHLSETPPSEVFA